MEAALAAAINAAVNFGTGALSFNANSFPGLNALEPVKASP